MAVVAPAQISGHVVTELSGLRGQPISATAVPSEAAGLTLLRKGSTSGVFIVNPTGETDSLLVASGGGAAVSTAVEDVFAQVEAAEHRTMTVTDAVPHNPATPGVSRASTWSSAGSSAVISSLRFLGSPRAPDRDYPPGDPPLDRARPLRHPLRTRGSDHRRPRARCPHRTLHGTLVARGTPRFCAAAVTIAFQVLLGVFGVGLTLILFVVLGNPSAGGAYQASLLPPFWRAIGNSFRMVPALKPSGASSTSARTTSSATWSSSPSTPSPESQSPLLERRYCPAGLLPANPMYPPSSQKTLRIRNWLYPKAWLNGSASFSAGSGHGT